LALKSGRELRVEFPLPAGDDLDPLLLEGGEAARLDANGVRARGEARYPVAPLRVRIRPTLDPGRVCDRHAGAHHARAELIRHAPSERAGGGGARLMRGAENQQHAQSRGPHTAGPRVDKTNTHFF
jgi:hypothetical protein